MVAELGGGPLSVALTSNWQLATGLLLPSGVKLLHFLRILRSGR
jgi:hypothetical protein